MGDTIDNLFDRISEMTGRNEDWSDRRDRVMQRDGYRCQECGERFADSRPLEAAHIVARADGGSDAMENLRTLCIACHSDVDGWDVGDFDHSSRVDRVASYVYHRENLRGAAHTARTASLLGLDYDGADELLDEEGW